MQIKSLELKNFRCFEHLFLEDLPEVVVLASQNGRGKSSILDAIIGVKEISKPYFADSWNIGESFNGKYAHKWPIHDRPPLRIGAAFGEVSIRFQPSDLEVEFLRKKGVLDAECSVSVVIEGGDCVTERKISRAANELLGFHSMADCVGVIARIYANRSFKRTSIGSIQQALDDKRLRDALSGFHREAHDQNLFTTLKDYLFSLEVSDLVKAKNGEMMADAVKPFRDAFNLLFSPKLFKGYGQGDSGPFISISHGDIEHDIDLLSDGEREIVYILGMLLQYSHSSNVILWDTPEAHLNATLESRLIEAVKAIAPENQYWFATHSLQLIESVDDQEVIVLEEKSGAITASRMSDAGGRVGLIRELGASVGVQVASKNLVFVEGSGSKSEKSFLSRYFSGRFAGLSFVAAGDASGVRVMGSRTIDLLSQTGADASVCAIIDRDYMSDSEVGILTSKADNLFVWPVHEFENIFLAVPLIESVMDSLGEPENQWGEVLLESAKELREWIAADWVAWEISRGLSSPSRYINPGDQALADLLAYSDRVRGVVEFADKSNAEQRYRDRLQQVDGMIDSGEFVSKLPGKQLLRVFLAKSGCGLKQYRYMSLAIAALSQGAVVSDALESLDAWLSQQLAE